jgi:hypothetical protein
MKVIFMPRFVSKQQLYKPQLVIKALNFIADNKDECGDYAKQPPGET